MMMESIESKTGMDEVRAGALSFPFFADLLYRNRQLS